MTRDIIPTFGALAGSAMVLMARATTIAAASLTQADCESIRIDLYRVDQNSSLPLVNVDASGNDLVANSDGSFDPLDTPSIASVVFDTLQTDSRWNLDSTGYNVAYMIEPPQIGKTYELRCRITLVSGSHVVAAWKINAE